MTPPKALEFWKRSLLLAVLALAGTHSTLAQAEGGQVLVDKLNVMDATAVVMCRDNNLPLRVFNMTEANSLVEAMTDPDVGTLVTA